VVVRVGAAPRPTVRQGVAVDAGELVVDGEPVVPGDADALGEPLGPGDVSLAPGTADGVCESDAIMSTSWSRVA
jgi:hypothetical protein